MEPLTKTICCVAGKSGGHIIPCITIAQHQYPGHMLLFFSLDSLFDKQLLDKNLYDYTHAPLPLHVSYKNAWYALPKLFIGLCKSFFISIFTLYKKKPERIITTGGLIALPVCFAAYLLRIPIDLYELNVKPGKATRFLQFFATHIYVCFTQTKQFFITKKCSLVTYPIKYTQQDTRISPEYYTYGFNKNIPILLILGGSQGSVSLNKAVQQAVAQKTTPLQIIHQTGSIDTTNWKLWYQKKNIPAVVFAYKNNLSLYFAMADFVICRAGAGTLAEVAFFKKPCIIIPLEGVGDNHQVANAYAYQTMYPKECDIIRQEQATNDTKLLQKMLFQKLSHHLHNR